MQKSKDYGGATSYILQAIFAVNDAYSQNAIVSADIEAPRVFVSNAEIEKLLTAIMEKINNVLHTQSAVI